MQLFRTILPDQLEKPMPWHSSDLNVANANASPNPTPNPTPNPNPKPKQTQGEGGNEVQTGCHQSLDDLQYGRERGWRSMQVVTAITRVLDQV